MLSLYILCSYVLLYGYTYTHAYPVAYQLHPKFSAACIISVATVTATLQMQLCTLFVWESVTAKLIGVLQMGVQNIFLDAANETAHKVWTAPTLGFHMITEAQFNVVRAKWTLVHNSDVFSRLWKVVPEGDALLQQVCLCSTCLPTSHDSKHCLGGVQCEGMQHLCAKFSAIINLHAFRETVCISTCLSAHNVMTITSNPADHDFLMA